MAEGIWREFAGGHGLIIVYDQAMRHSIGNESFQDFTIDQTSSWMASS